MNVSNQIINKTTIMKKIFKAAITTIAISVLFIFSGCNKSLGSFELQPFNLDVNIKSQKIASSDWVQTGSESKQQGSSVWIDNFSSLKACKKDDRFVFRANGTYEVNEGPTKCSSSDPQILTSGTWTFTSPTQEAIFITIYGQLPSPNLTIVTLDFHLLVFSHSEVIGGITYEYKETYKY